MKNIRPITLTLLLAVIISSCVLQQETKTKCGSIMCTDMFVSVTAKLIATKSSTIDFKSYKVINMANGKDISSKEILSNQPATLVIADDSNRKNFPEKGLDLQLQVTRNDGRVVKVDYKIGGGPCACHVTKLSGPDQVDIDR